MVYLLFRKSEGVSEQPVVSPEPDASESSPSLGHRVTLFTTSHGENGTAIADPTRIVLPVTLGHPAGTGTATRKWHQRRAFHIATSPKQMARNISPYVTPENVHDKLSAAADAVKDENSAIQRVGMACYEDLSNQDNFRHRRIIAKGLSDKLGVPIPDIFHIRELQRETGNTDQPLKYFEDTILHPMRAIAAREGLDLSHHKDELTGTFQTEVPALGRLNQIITHWDSQGEEFLPEASASGSSTASVAPVAPVAPTASVPTARQVIGPQFSVGLPDTKDALDETGIHTYPHSNITQQAWKREFSNLVDSPIPFKDRVTKEQLIAKSSETLYQAGKFKKNDDGSLSEICKKVLSGNIKGLPGTETLPQSPSSLQIKQFVANYLKENPEQADPTFYDKRIAIMKNILLLKAKTNKRFADALYESGTDPLVESTWGRKDTFWGVTNDGRTDGTQQGRNVLGKLLMQIRDELFPLKSSVAPQQPSQQVFVPSGTQLDLLKTTMSAKAEPYNRLFSKAIIGEDGSTVDISRLDRNFLENREPGFSRLISTPQGMFVEIHKVEGKTKVSDKGQPSRTSIMHERETPPSTRSTHIFVQTENQNGFMKGKWYAPLEDYLPR